MLVMPVTERHAAGRVDGVRKVVFKTVVLMRGTPATLRRASRQAGVKVVGMAQVAETDMMVPAEQAKMTCELTESKAMSVAEGQSVEDTSVVTELTSTPVMMEEDDVENERTTARE